MNFCLVFSISCWALLIRTSLSDEPLKIIHELFDQEPDWIGFRNRLLPCNLANVRQDFGFCRSHFAGGNRSGEIGGRIHRAHRRAMFAKPISKVTLNNRLSASGKFSVRQAEGSSGVLIGWFDHDTSLGWRTPNSLAFRIDGNNEKYWLFYEYGTQSGRTGGGGAFAGERYQTTKTKPFRADGTTHTWQLTYDPRGAQGQGWIEFRVDERRYELPLHPGHKLEGASFNRFGIWNQQTPGNSLEFYLDDLVMNGVTESFDKDPNWIRQGTPADYQPRVVRPYHEFGYRRTNYAGGARGEIGGVVFRDERPMYYADQVGPFHLHSKLHASGKIAMLSAGADSAVHVGWFGGLQKESKNTPEYEMAQTDWLGIMIEGPSRVGHFFRAGYATRTGQKHAPTLEGERHERPVIRSGKTVHDWSITYDPQAAKDRGRISVTFDQRTHDLELKPNDKMVGATFDRFGVFNMQTGGHHVEVYLDDLKYTHNR